MSAANVPPATAGAAAINLKCLSIVQVPATKQWLAGLVNSGYGQSFWVVQDEIIDGKYKVCA